MTINGGTVTATGGESSTGIGGGRIGAGGAVTINGGIITATGGNIGPVAGAGAGIGGAFVVGTLAINGSPDAGSATDGGDTLLFNGGPAPISNPSMPPGVGYSAVTSVDGFGGRIVIIFNYLVTFDGAGGSATASQTVNEGGAIAEPPTPTREGFDFAEWRVGDQAYDFSTPVTDPVTLTAAWTPVADETPELADTGADQGLFFPAALALLLMGGTLVMVGRVRRA